MCGSAEGVFDYNVCLGEALFDAAPFPKTIGSPPARLPPRVNRRSVGLYRGAGVGNERERGIFDLYQVEGMPGDVFVVSGYCGYFIADEPHLSVEYRDVRGDVTSRHIERSDDSVDSGQVARRCYVHRDNCRVRMWTAKYLAGQHPGELNVGGVFRLARELSRRSRRGPTVLRVRSSGAPRSLDGLDNSSVCVAAADVSGESGADGFVCRVWILFKERHRAHEESGGAEAALGAVVLQECLLYRVERVRGRQSLNGADTAAGDGGSQGHTGVDWQVVQENRAGSALATVAAALGTSQAENFAQNVLQGPAGIDFEIVRLAVHFYGDGKCVRGHCGVSHSIHLPWALRRADRIVVVCRSSMRSTDIRSPSDGTCTRCDALTRP